MASPTQITISQLSRLIGTPNGPILIDVRIDEDFEDDQRLIPTSFRYHFSDVGSLLPRFKSERVVVICQKGRKLSEGAAAVLRDHGIAAEALEGGHFAWRDANEPLIPASKLPKPNSENRTVWVTRHRPKIDRIACPWLIRRFVDKNAQFLFVAPSEVINVAEKFEATPFDIEDVFWSHRGERCTFDIMIEEFSTGDSATTTPCNRCAWSRYRPPRYLTRSGGTARGLAWSISYVSDDLAQLDAGMVLYDAFYRWARDATDEGHDWPSALNRN